MHMMFIQIFHTESGRHSNFIQTLLTVVTHFPSALLLHYFKLYYFDILLYIQAINSRYTHLFKDMCYYYLSIYLSCLYTFNVHVESFVTVGNETYLGYLLQTAHMFLMKLTWFMIPDFLCSHLCFFCKGLSSCKRTGSPRRAPRECCLTKVSPSACLISQNTKKKTFKRPFRDLL